MFMPWERRGVITKSGKRAGRRGAESSGMCAALPRPSPLSEHRLSPRCQMRRALSLVSAPRARAESAFSTFAVNYTRRVCARRAGWPLQTLARDLIKREPRRARLPFCASIFSSASYGRILQSHNGNAHRKPLNIYERPEQLLAVRSGSARRTDVARPRRSRLKRASRNQRGEVSGRSRGGSIFIPSSTVR